MPYPLVQSRTLDTPIIAAVLHSGIPDYEGPRILP